jgi:hypothetical protein
MCAWHLKEGTSQKDYAPFLFGAFPLLPIEAKLWNERRLEFGQEPAESSHPLLHTPVARLPLAPIDPLPDGHPLLGIAAERILADGLATRVARAVDRRVQTNDWMIGAPCLIGPHGTGGEMLRPMDVATPPDKPPR